MNNYSKLLTTKTSKPYISKILTVFYDIYLGYKLTFNCSIM